ncbi:MAG TPA: SagB/ThcOx family dehydrogenase [Anaerolineaceae bacterium]|nr:SagB/ThcOx family dehydrogenase [Anaerolineaceae bacterium]
MTEEIGKRFMELSRYENMEDSQQKQGIVPQPPLELPYLGSGPCLDLPRPEEIHLPSLDLLDLINRRKTLRKYSPKPLSLTELSFLLWTTQGVKQITKRPVTFRTVPSAGARHAFETYILVNRVDGLEKGLYRYLAIRHQIARVEATETITEQVSQACLEQDQIIQAAVTLIWVAVPQRMVWRYGERGYRYLHLDAGHVCQNLYLAAEAIECGVCAIAAFDDVELNRVMSLDGEEQFVIYLGTVGKK